MGSVKGVHMGTTDYTLNWSAPMQDQCAAGLHHKTHELMPVRACVCVCARACVFEFKYMEIPHSV